MTVIGKTVKESISIIDKIEDRKERYKFLKENKEALIAQKKAEIKHAMSFSLALPAQSKTDKSEPIDISDRTKIEVKVICNLSMYLDGHSDVQGDKCWDKSLQEGQDKFYHTKNHSNKIDDMVGKVKNVEMITVNLKDLGLNTPIKTGQALVMTSDVYKSLDEKIFTQYALGLIKQHSVGMFYVKLDLAIDDIDSEVEYKVWNKWIDKIINREKAEKQGYFWYVAESGLIENSAVTRGSNDMTPTLDVKTLEPSTDTSNPEPSTDTSNPEPSTDTSNPEPSKGTQKESKSFYNTLLN